MAKDVKSVRREKLTKKVFMGFRTGQYLISNVTDEKAKPVFDEPVAKISEREEQWKRIKAARVDQRLYHLLSSKKQHDNWIDSMASLSLA